MRSHFRLTRRGFFTAKDAVMSFMVLVCITQLFHFFGPVCKLDKKKLWHPDRVPDIFDTSCIHKKSVKSCNIVAKMLLITTKGLKDCLS